MTHSTESVGPTFGQRVAASDALLEAELDTAATKSARVAIFQKLLDNRREIEKFTEAQYKMGTGSEVDCLKAKADRAAAESRLAKEKAAADTDDSSSKTVEPAKPRGSILLYTTFGSSVPIPKGMTRAELMDKLLAAIDRRLNSGAEKLARVRVLDNGPIFVEVALLRPGDTDRQRVERLLSRPGMLEFRILANPIKDKQIIERASFDQRTIGKTNTIFMDLKTEVLDAAGKRLAWWVPVKGRPEPEFYSPDATVNRRLTTENHGLVDEVLVMADSCNVTGEYLTKAEVGAEADAPRINLTFNDAGGKLIAKLTGHHLPDKSDHVSYRLGIIIDGELWTAPVIREVTSNKCKITGKFTKQEAAEIADALNAGSLPVRLNLLAQP